MSIEGQIASAEAELLYERARAATVCIVEIGAFRGRSTVALALGSQAGNGVPVYSIDPHEQAGEGEYPYGPADRAAWTRNVLDAGVADIVRPINLPSVWAASAWNRTLDLLFIDGEHEAPHPHLDLDNWTDHLVSGSVIMHDRHAEGVQDAIRHFNVKDRWRVENGPGSIVELWRK